jgi:hypothetical protein
MRTIAKKTVVVERARGDKERQKRGTIEETEARTRRRKENESGGKKKKRKGGL